MSFLVNVIWVALQLPDRFYRWQMTCRIEITWKSERNFNCSSSSVMSETKSNESFITSGFNWYVYNLFLVCRAAV